MSGAPLGPLYLTVGHVTIDLVERAGRAEPERRPGGGAFHSALQAARLGMRARIFTQGVGSQIDELLGPYADELSWRTLEADATTTLATAGSGPTTRQRVLAWAGPIDPEDGLLEEIGAGAAIVHAAPVALETPVAVLARMQAIGAFTAITPQGLLRRWEGRGGEIALTDIDDEALGGDWSGAAFNERELDHCAALLERVRDGTVVAVTRGAEPTWVHHHGGVAQVPVPDVVRAGDVDDLGAGDVFAAAFFIALWEGTPPAQAARFANGAA
ncbi:MAG TPA: PfkB family carbohydrate kinase, partial [Solirubrobacteraceae bacterium]